MKKLIASLVATFALALVSMAGYSIVYLDVGNNDVRNVGVAKVAQIDVTGSSVASGTVQFYQFNPAKTSSNLVYSVTCSSGAVTAALSSTNTFYLVAGDRILRTGTSTNGTARLIVSQ